MSLISSSNTLFIQPSEEIRLTSFQLSTSQLIQSFCVQATDSSVLLGMVCGSLFSSITKVHSARVLNTLFLKSPTQLNSYAIRGGANLFACMAEATGIHSIPKIIQEREVLGGRVEEGFGGWIHTTLTMILMKGSGSVLPPSLVLQHFAQDGLMLQLDEICGKIGLIEAPTGNFMERMMNAEIMTCQMMASGALMHCTFSQIKMFEMKGELKNSTAQKKESRGREWFLSSELTEMAMVGGEKISTDNFYAMSRVEPWERGSLFKREIEGESAGEIIKELYLKSPEMDDSLKKKTGERIDEILAKVKGKFPKTWKLKDLDTLDYETAQSLAKVLAQFSPEIVRERFGEDGYWFILASAPIYEGFLDFLRLTSLSPQEQSLFRIARSHFPENVNIPSSFRIKSFRLFQALLEGKLLNEVDFYGILESCAIGPKLSQKLEKYSIEGIWTGYPGWNGSIVGKWSLGSKNVENKDWNICLDGSVGILLLYEGEPSATIAIAPTIPNVMNSSYFATGTSISLSMPASLPLLKIRQFQGIRSIIFDSTGREVNRISPRGLGDLNWKKALVKISERIARRIGFGTMMIQSAYNNPWLYNEDGSVHLSLDIALKIYDETAEKMEFKQGEDRNWYKVL